MIVKSSIKIGQKTRRKIGKQKKRRSQAKAVKSHKSVNPQTNRRQGKVRIKAQIPTFPACTTFFWRHLFCDPYTFAQLPLIIPLGRICTHPSLSPHPLYPALHFGGVIKMMFLGGVCVCFLLFVCDFRKFEILLKKQKAEKCS